MESAHFDLASVIIGVILTGCCLIFKEAWDYLRSRKIKKEALEPVEEIVYPLEPMFENYCSIMEDILSCTSTKCINLVYVRIIIFESCYKDSISYTSELMHAYSKKEVEIKSQTH